MPISSFLLIALVILGGALIAAQGPIYVRMAAALGGPLPAAALAFAIGTLALGLVMAVTRTPWPDSDEFAAVPVWVWLGGLIGAFAVLVSILAVPRLGVASYAVFVITGQLGASALYDRTGLFGNAVREFSTENIAGLGLVILGAVMANLQAP